MRHPDTITAMARLSATERAQLPDSAFAYVDSQGKRRLPIHDASHVRNALARFDRIPFESEDARQRSRQRLLAAAKRHGIVPLGFIDAQLRNNRTQATAGLVLIEAARIKTPLELEQKLRRALADPTFSLFQWSDEVSSWTDGEGQTITLPPESKHQKVTLLEAHGRPSTALIHGPMVLKDPDLTEAVLAAVRFVVERQRLERESYGRTIKPAHLPTGFVTHLLTDVEGSTELLTYLSDRYAAVLAKVRKIISLEIRRNGGYEVEVRADDSYAVFEDAADAVRAAVGFQRRLETTRWPDRLHVRVRVGIHSGDISLSDGGYVGLSLNTAARVMAAGHGGQILTTRTTQDAIGSKALDGVMFQSLGAHRFAGLPEPVELLQVDAEGLVRDLPRPRVTAT
jgi:class 3 adenylate cyclase